ncbi:MAG: nitrite reductase (NAD(P)H) small subunit [Pseudomonadota bacterium]|nr:nitrite reductase (NAD(P)H) small subunit [Pseudomonadota bacterium]
MHPRWTPAFPLDRVPVGGARLYKHDELQVAVFHLPDGVYAVDNRCPHQGYPLLQGAVSGCVVTCKWHNYKFNLRDGACVMGEEPVRSYPVRIVDGQVEIDLAPSPALLAGLWADLTTAMERHEPGRIARNVVRLLDLGVTAAELARFGATFDADHGEYGPSHALALAAAVAAGTSAAEPVLPLVQALDLAARSNVRLPRRSIPEPIDPGDDPSAAGARVRVLIETEQGAEAEALVRGAVARGWGRAELQPWFFQLCADHFLDFGHALIYSVKVFELLDTAPSASAPRDAASLLGALTWGITCGTRADLLPGWAGWLRRIAETHAPTTDQLALDALVDAEPASAFALVAGSSDPLDALSLAAAERLLRFDPAIDADATVGEGWLDVTHTLTFVNAVRHARRHGAPDVERLMLQAAHFVAITRALDGARREIVPEPATIDEVVDAVGARRGGDVRPDAVDLAAGCLGHHEIGALAAALEARMWRDHATRAIFLAHLVKTLRSGAEEATATGDSRPFLAAIRFLAAPLRERNVERAVHEAIALVRHGRPPRSLVS